MGQQASVNPPAVVMNALWIGPTISALHLLCLLSAVRAGHPVRLWSYTPRPELPGEIEVADGREILDDALIIRHRQTGSPALFSDRFRFELIGRGYGAWMDTDLLVLRRITAEDGFIASRFDSTEPSVAVWMLLYPPGSPLSETLLHYARQTHFIPPWQPFHRRFALQLRRALGLDWSIAVHRWGSVGPLLMWHACALHGWTGRLSPMARFAPIPYAEKDRPFRADGDVEAVLTDRVDAIHLYHQGLSGGIDGRNGNDRRDWRFEPGSFLYRQAVEIGLPRSMEWRK
jgi:hypothetical protein